MPDNTFLVKDLLYEGLDALENEDREVAQTRIQQAIKLDPHNPQLWFWCAKLSDSPGEQLYCYQRMLQYEPLNQIALEHTGILCFLGHRAKLPAFLPATTNETIKLKGYTVASYTQENNPFEHPSKPPSNRSTRSLS
jgi:hypothetical protein